MCSLATANLLNNKECVGVKCYFTIRAESGFIKGSF